MSKNNKSSSTGFYDAKLKIQVFDLWLLKNDYINPLREKDYLNIYYFRKGKFLYYCENRRLSINEGSILITKFNGSERIKTDVPLSDFYNNIEVVSICIHPTLFQNIKGDSDFYRLFNASDNPIEKNIYTKNEFENFDVENNIFKNIDRYIKNKMGLINFFGLISTLITELNFIFDKKNGFQYSSNSDEYMVKVFDYISSNFMTNITLESVSNMFTVSKFYIETVTKRFYSHSFHKTITIMRMWHARDLMKKNKTLFLADVAQLCGYNDYSGFYKVYSRFFNVSPKKDFEHYKKHNKFLSYDFN